MGRNGLGRALRPIAALAVVGAALGGCGGGPSGYYGGGGGGYYGGPGYYGSPYSGRYDRGYGYGSRGYYGGGRDYGERYSGGRRTENWSQERLRQHWTNQMQRAR